jgi:hypothetical protein
VLHCPAHFLSQNVLYFWKYQDGLSRALLPSSENYFVSNNGTLYFSILYQKNVDFINNNDGIFCEQEAEPKGAASLAKRSHRIKLNPLGSEGMIMTIMFVYNMMW